MATLIIQLLLAALGLAATIFAWWMKNDADKKKAITDEDKEIDSANDANSLLRFFNRLRGK